LKTVLAMVDINVLDHIIIGKGKPFSFAEAGLL
jgi:DNA repair protein RadC